MITKVLDRTQLVRDDIRKGKFPWADSTLDNSYSSMINRCRDINNPRYAVYGGKGIKVEDLDTPLSFQNFALSIKGLWMPGYEIHRLNSDDNYRSDNCIFLNSFYHTKYTHGIVIRVYKEGSSKYDNIEYYGSLRDWNAKMHLGHGFLSNKFGNDIESMNEYIMWRFEEFFPKEKGWKVDNLNPIDHRDKCVEIDLGLHRNIMQTSLNMQIPDLFTENSHSFRYVDELPLIQQYKIRKTESWWSKYLGYHDDYIGNKFRNMHFDFERQIAVREFIISELIKKHPEMVDMSMIEGNY